MTKPPTREQIDAALKFYASAEEAPGSTAGHSKCEARR